MKSTKRERFMHYMYHVQLFCKRLFGLHLSDPDPMSYAVVLWLIVLSVGLGVALLASNLAAIKIWNLWGIPVDSGIWLFPLTYVMGDLLVEIYGEKIANIVAMCCAGFTVLVILILCGVSVLPDFPGVDNSAFLILRAAINRTSLASIAGFLCSQIINNRIFVRVRVADIIYHRNYSEGIRFYRRAFISSAIAHGADALLFEILAFLGRVSFSDFLLQAGFAYATGIVLEVLMSLLTRCLIKYKLYNLHYTDGRIEH